MFAQRYPARTTALVMISAVSPQPQPERETPDWALKVVFSTDFLMWATITAAQPQMIEMLGVTQEVQATLNPAEQQWAEDMLRAMLPITQRADGIQDDFHIDRNGFHLDQIAELKKAKALQQLVAKLGLEVENLRVEIRGDTATVHGQVDDQAEREKVVLALGNVVGIARVDDRLEAKKKAPEAVFHTVQKGETLSKIAQQHYGSASKYPVIFAANKPMLSDPDKIYPGQVLRIPPLPGAA